MPSPAVIAAAASVKVGLASQFASLFLVGDSWFDASNYTVDGVSGKVASFVDRNDATHSLVQATSGNQVAIPTSNASFNNAPTASFVLSSVNYYVSNRALTAWRFLHNGAGCTVVWVGAKKAAVGNQALYGSINQSVSGGNGPGVEVYTFDTSSNVRSYTGTNGGAVFNGLVTGGLALSTPTYLVTTYGSPNFAVYAKSTSAASGTQSISPVATNPSSVLTLGAASSVGQLPSTQDWRALYVFARVLNSTQLATVGAYIQLQTSIIP